MITIFGDIVGDNEGYLSIDSLRESLKKNIVKPKFRVSILNPDETVKQIIPEADIPEDGIDYTESYQNGQRRNFTLTLINSKKQYTPSINGLWLQDKFKLEIGLKIKNKLYWFPRGVYIMGDVNLTHADSERTVQIQMKDKYAMFEDKGGTLESGYEIPVGSNAADALRGLINTPLGNGYIMDYQPIIFDKGLASFKTQATIRVDEGGNISQIIDALAVQMSAEYYYNNVGNLCFYSINSTVDDSVKPIIWTYENLSGQNGNYDLNYKNSEVINVVKVVGDNIDYGVFSATVVNNNPASPICIQQIGRRTRPQIRETNVWSQETANDLARYCLRQGSFLGVDFETQVQFNPALSVNNIIEAENKFLNFEREKLLIKSISFGSSDGIMSLSLCNTSDLPFL